MMSVKVEDRGANKSSWHFVVSETVRHIRGHTLYRVTLQIIPVDVSESIQEIVWWKRYSDFQVLHKSLVALHTALFLKGTFPSFPKPVVLGRHDEHVIEERRQAAVRLLNFISDFPILCRHDVMKEFLQGGEEICCPNVCDPTEVLQPKRFYVSDSCPADFVDELILIDDSSESGKCRDRDVCLSPVGGIWQHRQEDQLSSDPSGEVDDVGYSELVIPSAQPNPLDIPQDFPINSTEEELNSNEESSGMSPKKKNAMVVSVDHFRLIEAPHQPQETNSDSTKSDLLEEDYLFIAGHHLARANDKELAGDFEVSFGLYKLGIDILLHGVQTDKDPVRRDAVRRKAAKYLAKAEQLYNDHINGNLSDNIEPLLHSEYSTAAGTRAELAEYTVVSVVNDKVTLVMHRTSHETLVLKVLSKSPSSSAGKRRDRRTIIPLGPQQHMVQLRRFIETDDSVFMILERAPGGRLLDYIGKAGGEENRPGLRKTESASSELSKTSSGDCSTSWKKLVVTMTTSEEEGGGDYADLFFKLHAMDADRSRSSSLAQVVDRPTFSTSVSVDSVHAEEEVAPSFLSQDQERGQDDDVFDWTTDCLFNSVDLTEVLQKSGQGEAGFLPDVAFLQSVEPSASPTLRGLANWRNVSEIDSDQLVAKSKELLQSLDRTIQSSEGPGLPSRSASPNPPEENAPPRPDELSGQLISDSSDLTTGVSEDPTTGLHDDKSVLRKMPETLVRIWAAEIILAVEALHELGIVCADLDLHNLLLGEKGHVKLTYFSQWNSVISNTFDQAARLSARYQIAPELRKVGEKPRIACDTWSIGIIIFELLAGQRFDVLNPASPHTHRSLAFPPDLTREADDLLRKMLKFSPRERLTLPEVRQHPLFHAVDWRRIQNSL